MAARLLTVGLFVALLAAAGCGGGSGNAKSEFKSKAGAICSKYTSELKRLFKGVSATNREEIVAAIDKSLPVLEKGNGELERLDPPKDLRSRYEVWTGANAREVAIVRRLRDGLKAGNVGDYVDAAQDLARLEKTQDRRARRLGLSRCASS
jgi:hypothetical protein